MGDYMSSASSAGDAASTATDTASTAVDTASTAGDTASNMGPMVESGTSGTNLDGTSPLFEHSPYESTAPEQGGYFVSEGPYPSQGQGIMEGTGQFLDRWQSGAEGNLADAWNNFREGNYVEGMGYLGNKASGVIGRAGGGGQGQAAPISVNAAQPNPDNSYLQKLRQIRMSQGGGYR